MKSTFIKGGKFHTEIQSSVWLTSSVLWQVCVWDSTYTRTDSQHLNLSSPLPAAGACRPGNSCCMLIDRLCSSINKHCARANRVSFTTNSLHADPRTASGALYVCLTSPSGQLRLLCWGSRMAVMVIRPAGDTLMTPRDVKTMPLVFLVIHRGLHQFTVQSSLQTAESYEWKSDSLSQCT